MTIRVARVIFNNNLGDSRTKNKIHKTRDSYGGRKNTRQTKNRHTIQYCTHTGIDLIGYIIHERHIYY